MNLMKLFLAILSALALILPATAQIQSGKSINITISNVPDQDRSTVSGVYPVSDSGTINMPFIGHVRAAGLRNEQLASSLESQYKSAGIYTHPTIQVITNAELTSVNQETVVIGGQVRRPGPVPFTRELTLWGAIQAAGGATEFGSMGRVTLTREGKQKTYDVRKAQFMQIPLQRNDTIEVPQKTPWGT